MEDIYYKMTQNWEKVRDNFPATFTLRYITTIQKNNNKKYQLDIPNFK